MACFMDTVWWRLPFQQIRQTLPSCIQNIFLILMIRDQKVNAVDHRQCEDGHSDAVSDGRARKGSHMDNNGKEGGAVNHWQKQRQQEVNEQVAGDTVLEIFAGGAEEAHKTVLMNRFAALGKLLHGQDRSDDEQAYERRVNAQQDNEQVHSLRFLDIIRSKIHSGIAHVIISSPLLSQNTVDRFFKI